MSFRSSICAAVLLLAACADSPPIPVSDASTGNDSSTSTDSGVETDATTMDEGVVFTDGGVDDATSDAPLLSCVDSCGNGDCETRVRLRAQCLQGEAEMSTCTRYVADFSCHDAGF